MKNPNPIIPPGMNLDKSNRGRSNMRIAVVVIVLVHIALFGGILFNACSQKDDDATDNTQLEENKISKKTPPAIPSPSGGASDFDPLPAAGTGTGVGTSDSFAGSDGGIGLLPSAGGGIEPSQSTGTGTDSEGASGLSALPSFGDGTGGTTEPAITASSPTTVTEHAILSGDHFTSIAKKYGVTVRAIQDVNPSLDSRRLQIGQIVKIPTIAAASSTAGQAAAPLAADEYVIQRGDSLSIIAQRHGTTVKALRAANNLKTDLILAGEKLKLPPGSRFSTPASSTGTGSFLPPPPGTE